ncbi:MAG: PEGA domain-containing protein [Bacteroidota bacterium]
MSRINAFLISVLWGISVYAQSGIKVESFQMLPNDLDARVHHPQKDQNGETCAIIKVVTTQTGFEWEPDGLGIADAPYKIGEYWLYVPRGARRITIKHSKFGVLRNYHYTLPVEAATVYEMVLAVDEDGIDIEEEKIVSHWLNVESQPSEADVFINEQWVGATPFRQKYPPGVYTYRIEKKNYVNEPGRFEVINDAVDLKFALRPDFGNLIINSLPENGMRIYLDDENTGRVTPDTLSNLASGTYTVKLISPWYQTSAKRVSVEPGRDVLVDFSLERNDYGTLNLYTDPMAEVFINGRSTGEQDRKEIRLQPGVYELKAELEKHESVSKELLVRPYENSTLELYPKPRLGSLEIFTQPAKAQVLINDEYKGDTPLKIERLLIGDYQVVISSPEREDIYQNISIEQGQTVTLNEKLRKGKKVIITSEPSDVKLLINDKPYGHTPRSVSLAYDEYVLKLIHPDNRLLEKNIDVSKRSEERFHFVFETFEEPEMVIVEGGVFMMGCTEEKNVVCEENQIPPHQVWLDTYLIGRYPVTQLEWNLVMGSEDTVKIECPKCPVSSVSFEDIQTFIQRLNNLTGKTYRLPTEAEWEYAARGGNKSQNYLFSGGMQSDEVSWNIRNSGHNIQPVGLKKPNELGIYDMSGNIWETCQDFYAPYSKSASRNPVGPDSGFYRVGRGGSSINDEKTCTVYSRARVNPENQSPYSGFRLVLDLGK